MAYVTPSTVTAGTSPITAAAQNIIVNDVIDHEARINTVGSVLVSSSTFSASSAFSLNSVFTSTYVNYDVTFNFTAFSANTDIYLRLRAAGVDTTSATYQYAHTAIRTNGTSTTNTSGSSTFIFAMYARQGTGAPTRHNVQMRFIAPQLAGETIVPMQSQGDDGVAMLSYTGTGFNTGSTQYDGFTLYPNSGTFSGTCRVYGLRAS